jgi:hypothetical protein
MPFCRKCGRRLVEYSESCTDCGTSTTAPLLKTKIAPKKASAVRIVKAVAPKKLAKAIIPSKTTVSVKVIAPAKAAKTIVSVKASAPTKIVQAKPAIKPAVPAKSIVPAKTVTKPAAPAPAKPIPPAKTVPSPEYAITFKPVAPAEDYSPHEIIKSNVSLKEDFIAHPEDYEKQTFNFDLQCVNGHFWPEGEALPTSKGKALCPKCGELLKRPKRKRGRKSQGHHF